jgi:hypothetical protein
VSAKRAGRWVVLPLVVGATIVASSGTAWANHHLMRIREVFAGTSDHPVAQFVELQMFAADQTFVTNRKIQVFDASNTKIDEFVFTANVTNGATQATILVATADAQSLFGVTADLTMDAASIPAAGGKVCFRGSSTFGIVDCVSWGTYSGPPEGGPDAGDDTGNPASPAEGLLQGAALIRDISGGASSTDLEAADDTNDSAADFDFGAPSPRNNSGTTGAAPGGVFTFSATATTVKENAGNVSVTVQRTGGTGGVSVEFSTADGTALAGQDYASTSGTLPFGPADTSKTFVVQILNDTVDEPLQALNLRLRNPVGGAMLGAPMDATLSVADNDAAPSISVGDGTVTEGNTGTKNALFTLTLSAASEKTIKVTFSTADGSALAGQDYVAKSMRNTVLPGLLTKNVGVQIIGDTIPEPQETFTVTITLPLNATVLDGSGVGTINDND